MANRQQQNTGSFVQTDFIWNVTLQNTRDSKDFQSSTYEAFQQLTNNMNTNLTYLAIAVNNKTDGRHILGEFVNSATYFSNQLDPSQRQDRQVYRTTVDIIGGLPNTTTLVYPHGIDIQGSFCFTHIYGTATNPTGKLYLPIPYASSVANENISLSVDATNVIITTAMDYSDYFICYVVLEYVKN